MSVEISRLSNGLIVATDPMPQLESAFAGVWVASGARNEPKPLSGISHMLEHMAFKGTGRRSAKDISCEIEAVGGALNAYTGREQTAYQARVLKADVPLALELIADILIDPAYAPEELERERQVILQEIFEARDTPDDVVFDYLQEAAYPDQPMGRPVLGDEKTVAAVARPDLFAYLKEHYHAGGMVLAVSGAVTHAEILKLAEEKFSALPAGKTSAPESARYGGIERRVPADFEQAHLAIAFPGAAPSDPDYFAAQVYATALGGGMSSRLFQEVREKRGLCYTIYAFAQSARDGGLTGVYAATGEEGTGEIAAVIAGEMASLAETAGEDEVARAKAQMKAGLLMGLERPGTRAEMIASHLFYYGRVMAAAEIAEKIEAVSVADVRRFGAKVMETGRPAYAATGRLGRLESRAAFAARFGAARDKAAE